MLIHVTLGHMEKQSGDYNTTEVAEILSVSRHQVYRLIKSGRLKAYPDGAGNVRNSWKITRQELDRFRNGGAN